MTENKSDMKRLDTALFLSAVFGFLLLWGYQESFAKDIRFSGGILQEDDSKQRSYTWSLQYFHDLNERWSVSFSWINEGHFEHNHRDGHSVQIWVRSDPIWKRVVLAAGIGPYRYYDTQLAIEGSSYENSHDWGVAGSLSAAWTTDRRWFFFIQSNIIDTSRSIGTVSLMAGIGWHLDDSLASDHAVDSSVIESRLLNEFAFLGGWTIVNSRDSEHATSFMLEYRRNLRDHFDWSISYLNEGNPGPVKRDGMLAQLWLVEYFFHSHLELGIAMGPYVSLDRHRNPESGDNNDPVVVGMITLGAAYEFLPRWTARLTWNRIATKYDRDTDVLLGGIGFRF